MTSWPLLGQLASSLDFKLSHTKIENFLIFTLLAVVSVDWNDNPRGNHRRKVCTSLETHFTDYYVPTSLYFHCRKPNTSKVPLWLTSPQILTVSYVCVVTDAPLLIVHVGEAPKSGREQGRGRGEKGLDFLHVWLMRRFSSLPSISTSR